MRQEYSQPNCQIRSCPQYETCCQACCEATYFRSNVDGNNGIDIMIIGQGAGKSEDINLTPENVNHRPFFGVSGRYLRYMLMSIIDSGTEFNIALENTVKFHPTDDKGKDRDPTPDEIITCRPNMMASINKYKPAVIIAAGLSTTRALLPEVDGSMGRLNGILHDSSVVGCKVVPMYHPSFLTRTYGKFKEDEIGDIYMRARNAITLALQYSFES